MPESLSIVFDPETSRRRFIPSPPKNPIDVEINLIRNHAVTLKYHIQKIDSNDECCEILFTEENKHTAKIQIFRLGFTSCNCEQYYKKQCGFCKHIAVLSYLDRSVVSEQRIFRRAISKIVDKIKISSVNTYLVYDSLKDDIKKIGNGVNEIKSGSLITKEKHPNYIPNNTPVALPFPYYLLDDIELFDYQHDILQKILTAKRAIMSMIMGMGKTLTSIAGIKHLETQNVLIICPKSVVSQWKSEIKRALGINSIFIKKSNLDKFINFLDPMIGICTYQTYTRNVEQFSKRKYKLVIADEIQFIRNDESKTWSSFKKLNCEYFWGLSGTVIENRLDDLYNIMDVIAPGLLGAKWKFDYKFKKLKSLHRAKVLYANKLQNIDELRKLISNNVFSYDKLNLAKPQHNYHYVALDKESKDKQEAYVFEANKLVSKSLNSPLTFGEKMMLQSFLLKARQCCNTLELIDGVSKKSPKVDKIIQIIDDICLHNNNKLVVYSEWTKMLDIIQRETANIKSIRFDGSLSSNERHEAINKFKEESDSKIFFSSDAGSLGIDGLQLVCNHMLHIELPWNPAKLDQRIGRLHRLRQTKHVYVNYVVATDTIESKIQSLLSEKREVRYESLFETTHK